MIGLTVLDNNQSYSTDINFKMYIHLCFDNINIYIMNL